MSMRVRLVNPPAAAGVRMVREGRCMQRAGAWTAIWAPISLATAAALLAADGFECALEDCVIEDLSDSEALGRIADFSPSMVVINTATPSIDHDLAFADSVKRALPDCLVAAIGIHVTALPEDAFAAAPGLDAVVLGEPEGTLLDLARAKRDGSDIAKVAGVAVRSSGGGIVKSEARAPLCLDDLPFPAWELVRRDLYRMPFSSKPFLLLGTSRGCPHGCAFCADTTYYGRALRTKSPARIAEELAYVRDRFGIRDFLFWSESFTLRRSWTMEVLEAILAADLDVAMVVNSRADHVDPELLAALKRAGCWMIGYGFESGSQEVLDLMGKRTRVGDNEAAARWSREAGLLVTAHSVLGYPGETVDTMDLTIDMACSLPIDFAQFYCAVPFPGSPLYERALAEGWLDPATPWSEFEQNRSALNTDSLSAEQVMDRRRRAYRRFYSDPRRAAGVLRDQVGLRGLPGFLRMAMSFREWL